MSPADLRHLLSLHSLSIHEGSMLSLAADLGVDYRLVRRWVAGERTIPDWVGPSMIGVLEETREQIPILIAELEKRRGQVEEAIENLRLTLAQDQVK